MASKFCLMINALNTCVLRLEHPYIVGKLEKSWIWWAHLPCQENCMLPIAVANQSACFSFSAAQKALKKGCSTRNLTISLSKSCCCRHPSNTFHGCSQWDQLYFFPDTTWVELFARGCEFMRLLQYAGMTSCAWELLPNLHTSPLLTIFLYVFVPFLHCFYHALQRQQ